MSTKRKLLVALALFLLILGGFAYWLWRGTPAEHTIEELSGKDPVIAEPRPETIPSVAIAKPIGWAAGEAPVAAPGLEVKRFAEGLDHPRVIHTLPNGDVIVAEAPALHEKSNARSSPPATPPPVLTITASHSGPRGNLTR